MSGEKKKRVYKKKTKNESTTAKKEVIKKPRKKRKTKAEKEAELKRKEQEELKRKEQEELKRKEQEELKRKEQEELKRKEQEELKRKEQEELKIKEQEELKIKEQEERRILKQKLEEERIANVKKQVAIKLEKQKKEEEENKRIEKIKKIKEHEMKKQQEIKKEVSTNASVPVINDSTIIENGDIIVSSTINKSTPLQAEYVSPKLNLNDNNIKTCTLENVFLKGVVFMYSNCYKDSFDLQIVSDKTDYENGSEITNIGLDDKGNIVPMTGGTIKIINARPVYCKENCGNWIFEKGKLKMRLPDSNVDDSYNLLAYNKKIKAVFIDFSIAGSGVMTFDFDLLMYKGYVVVFEHYFSDITTLGVKQANVSFKYVEKQ